MRRVAAVRSFRFGPLCGWSHQFSRLSRVRPLRGDARDVDGVSLVSWGFLRPMLLVAILIRTSRAPYPALGCRCAVQVVHTTVWSGFPKLGMGDDAGSPSRGLIVAVLAFP